MKRTTLRRGNKPLKRTRLRPKPSKRHWESMRWYVRNVIVVCEVPGCGKPASVPHHVEFRSQGGSDECYGPGRNICGMCPEHERMVHAGRLIVKRGPFFGQLETGGWAFSQPPNIRSGLRSNGGGAMMGVEVNYR